MSLHETKNPNLWIESKVDQRALVLEPEVALQGEVLASIETDTDYVADDFYTFFCENFSLALEYLHRLPADTKELILAYYVLGKTQGFLGKSARKTQTMVSAQIRQGIKCLCAFVSGLDKREAMAEVFTRAGLENTLSVPLSQLVELYARCRSFRYVAESFGLHRPDVIRAIGQAAEKLENGGDREQMLAAYLGVLQGKASAHGQGLSKRELDKHGDIYCEDNALLGEFQVDISNPAIDEFFSSRALR